MRSEEEIEQNYQETYQGVRAERYGGDFSKGYLAALEWVLEKGPYSYELDELISESEMLVSKYPNDFALKLGLDSLKAHREELKESEKKGGLKITPPYSGVGQEEKTR